LAFWPGIALLSVVAGSCGERKPAAQTVAAGEAAVLEPFHLEDEEAVFARYAGSQSCRECHSEEYEKWRVSNHGMAEREPDAELDGVAFASGEAFEHGSQRTVPRKGEEGFEIEALGFGGEVKGYPVSRVIGHDPIRQFLVAGERGRLHAMEACFDPKLREWFNVYGDEDRQPGEWGHWTGRGMVWNQMCASCHNTRVRKNYDPKTDSYHTTMAERTVGCESCHGPMRDHADWQRQHASSGGKDPHLPGWDRDQHTENCAGCHARRGEITGDFKPGDSFWDHYLLTITDHTDTYFPDGQVRDENFEFASFLSSGMAHSGVRCMDCHDSHSGKALLPGNQLCMRCHTPGGFPNAPPVEPARHTFHGPESTGSQCVNCHMPQTVYMQRHWRHDHGWTIPDPKLTVDFGVPNACNRCHQDQTADWALEHAQNWYGERLERHTRQRATLVARARQGDEGARDGLVEVLLNDRIPHWRASAALLLDPWAGQAKVRDALLAGTGDEHPLVRNAALRSLEGLIMNGDTAARRAAEQALTDSARSVRVAAAWALRQTVSLDTAAGKDLIHMLRLNADQPSGQMQLAQFFHARGDPRTAVRHMETAIAWDPNSPPFHHDLALLHSAMGDPAKTVEKLRDAIRLAPGEARYHFELGLALSETGDLAGTTAALREAVRLDPGQGRAWYNLGLALNSAGKTEEALDALSQGERADPADPGIPYASATILARLERREEAIAAADRALRIAPGFEQAAQLRLMLAGQGR
jgi:tetratricopeptide (TPR) repeat protein